MSTGASMRRGASKQDYATPQEFLDAVTERFGALSFDLAASADNCVVHDTDRHGLISTSRYFDESADSLTRDWGALEGLLWLNPPFGAIAPWVAKAAREASAHARILVLVPASVGTEWYAEHVHPHAAVLALRPRLSFDGQNPFPKDLLLCCYGLGVRGFDLWRWR